MNMKTPLYHQITHIAAVLDTNVHDDQPLDELPVLAQARRMAVRTRSALTLLAFVPRPTMADNLAALVTETNPAGEFEAVRIQLFKLARQIQREDHITVQCEIREARFNANEIADWLTTVPADLLVVNRPSDEAGMAMLSERYSPIIRELGTPVWFAGPDARPQDGVVAAVAADSPDEINPESDLAEDVLDVARGIVELFKSDLHVVQACPLPEPGLGPVVLPGLAGIPATSMGAEFADLRAYRTKRLADKKEALTEFVKRSGAPEGEILVAEGDVATTISAGAEAVDAGLIVMGASGKSRWNSLLFGGVAESTLAIAPCDLLLVKPAEKSNASSNALLSHESMLQDADELEDIDLLVNPRRYFHAPGAVAADEALTDQEKILVLSAWEEELANEIENEQMPQQVYESTTNPDELENVQGLLNMLSRPAAVTRPAREAA